MKVGISLDNTLNERWGKEITIIKKNISEAGGEVTLKTAFGLVDSQESDIRDLILLDKIDVLILVPVDSQSAVKMANFAKSKGVKVIAYSRPIPTNSIDFFIRFDAKLIGKNQAKYLTSKQPVGNCVIVHGPQSDLNTKYLLEGQMEVISSLSNFNILQTVYLEGWTKLKAKQVVDKLLNSYKGEITSVLAANDMIAEATHDCLYAMGIKNVLVTGLDAEVKACQRILNDQQLMTVLLPPRDIATCVSKVAMYLLTNKDSFISSYDVVLDKVDTDVEVKCINLDSLVLDKDNVKKEVEERKLFPLGWLK